MPLQVQNGYGAQAAFLMSLALPGANYSWEEGCGVVLGGSTTDIELQVKSGSVIHDGDAVAVSATSITLADGDPLNPRKDLIYIDREGSVRVQPGEAKAALPEDKTRWQTFVPAPPDTTGVDGVPIAAVWVPANATATGDLEPADRLDLRPGRGGGQLPVRSSTPSVSDLTEAKEWYNSNQSRVEYYSPADNTIYAYSQTSVSSGSATNTILVEDFEDSIKDNWRGGDSSFTYTTPAFQGSAAAYWDDSGWSTDYSLPGDGLDVYPEDGDTAAIAVYPEAGNKFVELGIGKESDTYERDYRARLDFDNGRLETVRVDDDSVTTLGSELVSLSADTWYWLEIEYDGGGEGIHPSRVYSTDTSTDPGTKDTLLAEVGSPTKDTTYRGRGVTIRVAQQARLDYYTVTR